MKQKLPTRRMREHPDLEQLKRQAKELLQSVSRRRSRKPRAEVNAHYRAADRIEIRAARRATCDCQKLRL